jgi:hypothetical protein
MPSETANPKLTQHFSRCQPPLRGWINHLLINLQFIKIQLINSHNTVVCEHWSCSGILFTEKHVLLTQHLLICDKNLHWTHISALCQFAILCTILAIIIIIFHFTNAETVCYIPQHPDSTRRDEDNENRWNYAVFFHVEQGTIHHTVHSIMWGLSWCSMAIARWKESGYA